MVDYVGIAGAFPDPASRTTVCTAGSDGMICNTGLLVANEFRSFRDASDGTSNTIIIAEQSATVGGLPIRSNYAGGWTGAGGLDSTTSGIVWTVSQVVKNPTMYSNKDYYHNGLTVVRSDQTSWVINKKTAPNGDDGFSCQPYETNTILNSFHPGLINVLLADASVRPVNDTIDKATFSRLCAANDGLPVGNW
jgi:hypothetical protein